MSDAFETVAVTYSQPEAAVMLSFLAWHDVHAYALSEHARVSAHLVTALGGIPIRVAEADVARARALLADIAPAAPVIRPPTIRPRALGALALLLAFVLGAPPPPPRVGSDLT